MGYSFLELFVHSVGVYVLMHSQSAFCFFERGVGFLRGLLVRI